MHGGSLYVCTQFDVSLLLYTHWMSLSSCELYQYVYVCVCVCGTWFVLFCLLYYPSMLCFISIYWCIRSYVCGVYINLTEPYLYTICWYWLRIWKYNRQQQQQQQQLIMIHHSVLYHLYVLLYVSLYIWACGGRQSSYFNNIFIIYLFIYI
jgi:uncharacterized membrane protein